MRHGILITANDNIPVVKTMFRMLDDERFTFYLLVDKKSEHKPLEFLPLVNKAKVEILPQMPINWGGGSQIFAEIFLIESALKDGQEYLHFIQGSDIPLKSAEQIDKFFRENNGNIYLGSGEQPSSCANYKVLCKHFFVECKSFRTNKVIKIINHLIAHAQKPFMPFKKDYNNLYIGTATWSIPKDFAEYLVSLKKDIFKKYRYSLAADEVFIHTIGMKSEYKERISTQNIRLVDWKNNQGNSPKTFTMADWECVEKAIKDPNIIFARKFSAKKDMDIVEKIYSIINNNC